jgi:selenocysteine lyase/cysteine desulfurase
LDDLREREYGRLDAQNHVYLDYTGGGLYADSQLREHMALLQANVFGNPHSHNPTSLAMTELVEQARAYVLHYFNADPAEYCVIFTPNASGALKLVGESYPFCPGSRYILAADDHNSVNGIREFARGRGATVHYAPLTFPELRLDQPALDQLLGAADPSHHNLFAFPAQSNYSGAKHPLELVAHAHAKGWDVLLDCAAFAPTNRLDLSRCQPDFAVFSFYKIFGYPTGLGALIARRDALQRLQRPWFAGGTVKVVSVAAFGHYLAEDEAGFEDGTINYLGIPALEIGLRHIESVGIETITERVHCLTGWLLDQLGGLRHNNGRSLTQIHGPNTLEMRGGTITISFFDRDGTPISGQLVEKLAAAENISLRTGCFCNPGAGETTFCLTQSTMQAMFAQAEGIHFQELVAAVYQQHGVDVSAVRVSVGLVTNFADVYRLLRFVAGFQDKTAVSLGGERETAVVYTRDTP